MTTETVLVIQPSVELYGADRMLLRSVEAIRDAGFGVEVVAPAAGRLVDVLKQRGFTVVVRPFPVARKAMLSMSSLPRFLACSLTTLASGVRRVVLRRPTAMYVNTLTAPVWVLVAWLTRLPVVLHVREAEPDGGRAWRLLTQQGLLATSIICNSSATEDALRAAARLPQGRTTVIHNGLLTGVADAVENRRQPLGLCLVGRISPRKGQRTAVEAMASIVARFPEARLVLAGDVFPGYEWFRVELEELVESLELEKNVIFAGFLDNPRRLYEESTICLVPSLVEPFGNVAVEAMGAGSIVVASNVQGLSEIVRHGETGVLVAPADAAALAEAVVDLLDDPMRQGWLRRAAAADAESRFSEAAYARRLVGHLREVAAR